MVKRQNSEPPGPDRFQQPVDLSWVETRCYIVIWVSSCFYAIYQVLVFSLKEGDHLDESTFDSGWLFTGRKRDKSDFEWQFWRGMILRRWPVYLGHIVLGQIFRCWKYEKRHMVFFLYGMFAVGVCITYKVLVYQVLICLAMVGVAYMSRSLVIVWGFGLAHLYTLEAIHKDPNSFFGTLTDWMCDYDDNNIALMLFSTSYLFMRYISFSDDLIKHLGCDTTESKPGDNKKKKMSKNAQKSSEVKEGKTSCQPKTFSPEEYLSYVFYFPLFFTGPIYTYHRFYEETHVPKKPWTKQSVRLLLQDVLRVTFWTVFMEVWLHYFYFYSIQHHHALMREIPYWMLAGVGYQVGQFFMVKYVSIFGIPGNIAKLDGLSPPYTPRCGGWIYKYSDMWRNFDKGLHGFMTRHVYFPLGGSRHGTFRQLLATMVCYLFVFVWHGGTMYMFVWAGLNFVDIMIEAMAKLVSSWPPFIQFEARYVPRRWGRRLRALCWTPVLMMNFLSSFTFFAGGTVGKIYAYRFLIEGFPVTHLTVGLAFYSFVQTSMEYENYLDRRKVKAE